VRTLARAFAAALLLAFAIPAQAQECAPLEAALNMARAHSSPIALSVTLDEAQSRRVVAWYNSLEPVSTDTFTLVVIVRHENNQVGLMMGNDGNICTADLLPPAAVPTLMRVISGEAA
jgi:hypothetical protein